MSWWSVSFWVTTLIDVIRLDTNCNQNCYQGRECDCNDKI